MNEIGNYRILKKLGEGGMGEVFMGEDIMLERKVAIKVLRPELSQREDILQRFRSEAVALGRLNHPNIATVYTFSKDGEHYYLAMEFVNGEPLDTVINKRGKLIWQDAVCYTCDALAGLEHAHRLNVIHRDIKPANIMLTHTGGIKLVDFGIARILEQARQTRTGYLIGTLEYISPEQVQGLDVDARSDIYSMGTVLYKMLTGRLPFQKSTDYELLQAQIKELPQSPRKFAEDIPVALENIILKALAKNPDKRFSTALEFSQALSALLHDDDTTRLYPTAKTTKPRKSQLIAFVKNYPIPVIFAILLLLTVTYFVINSTIKLSEIPIKKADFESKDDIESIVDKESTATKTFLENQPANNSPSINTQAVEKPQLPEDSVIAPPIKSNEVTEDNSQIKVESKPPEQKADAAAITKAKQKAKQDAQKKAEKERKRREALAKAKKEQSKRPAQSAETQKPKKESSRWVIIPGKTQKTY